MVEILTCEPTAMRRVTCRIRRFANRRWIPRIQQIWNLPHDLCRCLADRKCGPLDSQHTGGGGVEDVRSPASTVSSWNEESQPPFGGKGAGPEQTPEEARPHDVCDEIDVKEYPPIVKFMYSNFGSAQQTGGVKAKLWERDTRKCGTLGNRPSSHTKR